MTKNRWIAGVIAEADKCDVQMPWARGARRAAWIAKRAALQGADRKAA